MRVKREGLGQHLLVTSGDQQQDAEMEQVMLETKQNL